MASDRRSDSEIKYTILRVIDENPNINITEVSLKTRLNYQTLVKFLHILETYGLIILSVETWRVRTVHLTDDGKKLYDDYKRMYTHYRNIFQK